MAQYTRLLILAIAPALLTMAVIRGLFRRRVDAFYALYFARMSRL